MLGLNGLEGGIVALCSFLGIAATIIAANIWRGDDSKDICYTGFGLIGAIPIWSTVIFVPTHEFRALWFFLGAIYLVIIRALATLVSTSKSVKQQVVRIIVFTLVLIALTAIAFFTVANEFFGVFQIIS